MSFSLQSFPDHSTFKSHLSSVSPIVLWLLSELRQLQLNDMDCIRSLDLLVKRILALCEATGDLAVRGTAEDNFNFDNALMLFDKSLRGSAAALKRLALTAGVYQQPLGNYGQPPDTTLPTCEIPKLLKRVVPPSTSQLLDLTLKHLRRNDLYFNTIKGE
ncbi:hypothetical protein BDV40DRAFT_307094 [Aspergillus tamarii]|uniref:Uncharacterized protein n=1 Tax=Aspergillus tamarii TaxID=41984 RepID=A0A5N6U9T8_ASPTM|nr:hypothetical protein BDV40DRAFT_307094 [Aspergillus tamarii]